MNKEIFFSVIIPTYNRSSLLINTLNSVLNQQYPLFEVIIIDDGSTDNTKEVIQTISDNRIKYHFKENEERGVARNTGMELASGDYITFVDSDDLLYPNYLKHASFKLKEFKFPDFYRQAYETIDSSGKKLYANNKVRGDANKFILKGNYFSCLGIFLKKTISSDQKFNVNRNMIPSEDWEYWLRLSVRYKFTYDNTITASLLHHENRSMNSFNEERFKNAINLLVQSLEEDKIFKEKRGDFLKKIEAHMYSLLCFNKIYNKDYRNLGQYLKKFILLSPSEVFTKRTMAMLKYSFLNLVNR